MNLKSKIMIPVMAAALIIPISAFAVNPGTPDPVKASVQHDQKAPYQYVEKIATKYGLTDDVQAFKDLATNRDALHNQMKELKASPQFKAYQAAQQKAFHAAHKTELDAIKVKVKAGTITKEEAKKEREALHGKENKPADNSAARKALNAQLKDAVAKKDKNAIDSILKQLIQQQQERNNEIQKRVDDLKGKLVNN